MKLIVLFALVTICSSTSSIDQLVGLITKYGYPAQSSSVTTEDGYILQLVRIPNGRSLVSKNLKQNAKPAVLLMHGLMSNAEDFVYGGPTQGLAFYLADKGFDVYLGNFRGSLYGQKHTKLDPSKDEAFWKFCWQEMGVKDLPAIIDRIMETSGQRKINFVGHMEGATAFYVMASERPNYNEKIGKMVALGPIAFLKNSRHPLLKKIVENDNFRSKSWVMKNLGRSIFTPSSDVLSTTQTACTAAENQQEICSNKYFLLNGYNSKHFNQTTIRQVQQRITTGGSVREVLHFAQIMSNGRFGTFAELGEIRDYDLSKINVPVAVFYTQDDQLSTTADIETLISKLPNVFKKKLVSGLSNNLDLLYANDVAEILYYDVAESIN